MIDADRFAALICDWCLEVTPGQRILIDSTTAAEPLLTALQTAVLDRGGWPHLDLRLPGQEEAEVAHAQEHHFAAASPLRRALYEEMDTFARIYAPAGGVPDTNDPARTARWAARQADLRAIRMQKRWLSTLWPTPALAARASMDPGEYEAFVARALFVDADTPDPLGAWQALHDRQQQLVDRLTGARQIHIESDRTDLTLEVTGRVWQNSSGRRNMPSGEVFTSPLETSANGHIHFDIPSERGVQGVSVSFIDGQAVRYWADRGDEHLQAKLATDAGARRLGEIGIGTNTGIDRATGLTLLDEKIGGTVHLALGASYPECGGVNASAIHWDLICDLRSGGTLTVDGEVLSRDGEFV